MVKRESKKDVEDGFTFGQERDDSCSQDYSGEKDSKCLDGQRSSIVKPKSKPVITLRESLKSTHFDRLIALKNHSTDYQDQFSKSGKVIPPISLWNHNPGE
jgi:hypothetical protein